MTGHGGPFPFIQEGTGPVDAACTQTGVDATPRDAAQVDTPKTESPTPLPEHDLGEVAWTGSVEQLAERLWPGALVLAWAEGAIVGGLGSGGRLSLLPGQKVRVLCAGEEVDEVSPRLAALQQGHPA